MGKVVEGIVLFLYPAVVLAGLWFFDGNVRATASVLLSFFVGRWLISAIVKHRLKTPRHIKDSVIRFTSNRQVSIPVLIQTVSTLAMIGGAAITGSQIMLRFTPFGISLVFFAQFAMSLRSTPIIERFARLKRPDLPPDHVKYCRWLTRMWLLIFIGNSALVFSAAFVEPHWLWAMMVGPASYFYLGTFLAGEYIYRKWRFRDFNQKNPADRALRFIFEGRGA